MVSSFLAGVLTVKNGISVFPQTGVGQAITRSICRDQVRVENHGENGSSTKSYIDEGRMALHCDYIIGGGLLCEEPADWLHDTENFGATIDASQEVKN